MKKSVYIETSIVSYCASKPSRDIIIAARQQETQYWWENRIHDFEVFISELVFREASDGDSSVANKRIELIKEFQYLDLNEDSYSLAEYLIKKNTVPKEYPEDALHIAVASVHGVGFLLTWNFKHINNAERKLSIELSVNEYGYICPIICTPEELSGE